jgi:excinuclease UvrABC nuclease subunit
MTETNVVQALLEQLLAEPLYPLEKSGVEAAPDKCGVYVIYDAAGICIKVGRITHGRGLRERLRRHARGDTDGWLERYDGDRSKLGGRQVRWLVVDDPRQRCLLECLATGVLCPLFLGLGRRLTP